jgi:predicted transcriptional regulator
MEQSEKAIMSGLKKQDGIMITELINDSKLSRSTIRIALAKLEGAQNVVVRQIEMAKLYSLNKGGKRR